MQVTHENVSKNSERHGANMSGVGLGKDIFFPKGKPEMYMYKILNFSKMK